MRATLEQPLPLRVLCYGIDEPLPERTPQCAGPQNLVFESGDLREIPLGQAVRPMSEHHDRPLLTYYGDDFTGSTDVIEALARSGIRSALFLEAPRAEQLIGRFAGLSAVGVAGLGRSMTPEQMDAALPPVFEAIRKLGANLFHYKTCSTFDSSPEVGSIGRAN